LTEANSLKNSPKYIEEYSAKVNIFILLIGILFKSQKRNKKPDNFERDNHKDLRYRFYKFLFNSA